MDHVYKSNVSQTKPNFSGYQAGYPQSATPSSPATIPGPGWYYMLAEELLNVVRAGGIVPDAFTTTQVSQAVLEIAGNAATQAVGPFATQITNANANAGAALSAAAAAQFSAISAAAAAAALALDFATVIDSIAALRGFLKTGTTKIFLTGYYAPGDGGGGHYWLDPADTTSADNGGTVIVANDGGRWKLIYTTTLSIKQFGAKGDGITADHAAFAAVMSLPSSVTVYCPPGTYRFAASAAIPNSCFTRFVGVANVPFPSSIIKTDFNGYAFTSAAGNTSFYAFENFFCTANTSYGAAGFLNDSGAAVHVELKNIVLDNYSAIAISMAAAFVCCFKHILIQFCRNYGITVAAGTGSLFDRVTCDHTVAGGMSLFGAGITLMNCYWEECSQDNNPTGANASWYDLQLGGGDFTVIGGTFSASPTNNKAPINLNHAASCTFIGVKPTQIGAGAPAYLNLNANDASVIIIGDPGLTVTGVTTNVTYLSAGYTTTKPDLVMSGVSTANSVARVWCVFNGATGTNKQAQNISSVSRIGTGNYRIVFPATTFANTNYAVQISAQCASAAVVCRYANKTNTTVDVQINNSSSTSAVDADEITVALVGV